MPMYHLDQKFVSDVQGLISKIILDKDYLDEAKCCNYHDRMCGPIPRPPPPSVGRKVSCQKDFLPPKGAILTFKEAFFKTDLWNYAKKTLSMDLFPDYMLPLNNPKLWETPEKEDEINPDRDFDTNFYLAIDNGINNGEAVGIVEFAIDLYAKYG
jgi:hypothetical protein